MTSLRKEPVSLFTDLLYELNHKISKRYLRFAMISTEYSVEDNQFTLHLKSKRKVRKVPMNRTQVFIGNIYLYIPNNKDKLPTKMAIHYNGVTISNHPEEGETVTPSVNAVKVERRNIKKTFIDLLKRF